jgi:hypothetical protein
MTLIATAGFGGDVAGAAARWDDGCGGGDTGVFRRVCFQSQRIPATITKTSSQ